MKKIIFLIFNFIFTSAFSYTLLNQQDYKNTVSASRAKVEKILKASSHAKTTDEAVAWLVNQLIDTPYLHKNAMGEGDWQPNAWHYQPNATHIQQNPVYRLDGFDCQTFVQVIMAMLHAKNLAAFDKTILKIAYGAAGNPDGEIVRYYNRNHFIDADFNRVNQRNGFLSEVNALAPYTQKTSATITRQKWFSQQAANAIQTFSLTSANTMVKRYNTVYQHLNFPQFDEEKITLSYLPKKSLALLQADGSYKPNTDLLNKIPTPALAEIVRDAKQWNRYGIKMKDIVGSEFMVSHLGLLYRQTFKRNELIYHQTICDNNYSQITCPVKPVYCQKNECTELMFAHATNAFPKSFVWYKNEEGQFVCSPQKPRQGRYTYCNRVVTLPFHHYLTDFQFGSYSHMKLWSVLGVHIEKLS